MKKLKHIIAAALVLPPVVMFAAGCSRSNSILEGRVETRVGDHLVVVTDCYRTDVPAPERLADTPSGASVWRYAPCRDAEIFIRGSELVVNGTSYGSIGPADAVTVDHGKVLVNETAATPVPQAAAN